jgi:hypothetical protein
MKSRKEPTLIHRMIRHALLGIPLVIVACSSSDPRAPAAIDAYAGDDDDDDDEKAATPAPSTVVNDPPPLPSGSTNIDLTDPAAAAACAEIATRSPGMFTSDAVFEVTEAKRVAASFDSVQRLALAFDWPAQRVQDGNTVWRYDARLTLALELLEPTADRSLPVSATPYLVRVWKYEKSERACTTMEIGRNEPFVGEPMDGTATVLITKRNDTEVEGAITLHDAKGLDAKLSFHAPLVATLEKDPTFCCIASLGGR